MRQQLHTYQEWTFVFLFLCNLLYSYVNNALSFGIVASSLLLVVLTSLRKLGLWSNLYVAAIIAFLCLHQILDSIGLMENIDTKMLMGGRYSYSELSLYRAKEILLLFLSGTTLGFFFARNRPISYVSRTTFNALLLKLVFITLLVLNVCAKIKIFLNSRNVGYVEAIHGTTENNLLFILGDILFPVIFAILLMKIALDQKAFIRYSILYLLPYSILFLAGFRGELVGKLIAILCVYSLLYRIGKFRIIVGGVLSVAAILSMEFIRFDTSLTLANLPLESYVQAFMFAGNSFGVVPLAVEHSADLFHGWRYFFGGPLGVFSLSETYTVEGILNKPYLPQHLTYVIDKQRFSGGSTIGGSVLAEIFLLSPKLIMVVSALIPMISNRLVMSVFKSQYWCYTVLLFLENLIFVPRGGFLKFIDKEMVLGSVIFIFIFILQRHIKVNHART